MLSSKIFMLLLFVEQGGVELTVNCPFGPLTSEMSGQGGNAPPPSRVVTFSSPGSHHTSQPLPLCAKPLPSSRFSLFLQFLSQNEF